jgi:3-deoxy-D-manno-octulosonic-acid transferase
MFFLYNSLLLLATAALAPLPILILLFRRKQRHIFFERCALNYTDSLSCFTRRPFWIHAVSVGEVMASIQLIRELKRRFPEHPVVLSTTTATGNATARAHAKSADAIIYFPFDFPFIISCALQRIQPALFMSIETEIWPNLYRALQNRGIPALIVSGRISEKSFKNYHALRFFFRRVLGTVSRFCMQTQSDADRITSIGAPKNLVSVCGNIKFDLYIPAVPPTEKNELLKQFGLSSEQPILIAGSTHRGEEQQVLDAFLGMRKEVPELILLLAPRHPERFNEAAETIAALNIDYIRRTALNDGARRANEPVILLDSIGELVRIYSIGTVIFIGGSMVEGIGGHNPLEPALAGKPVIFGPHMSNFKEIARILTAKQAAFQIDSPAALVAKTLELLRSPDLRASVGTAACDVIQHNSGAVKKIADTVESILQQRS